MNEKVNVRFSFGPHTKENLVSLPNLKNQVREYFTGDSNNTYIYEMPSTPASIAARFNRRFKESKSVKDAALETILFPRLLRKPLQVEKDIMFQSLRQNPEQVFYASHYLILDELLKEGVKFDVWLENCPDDVGRSANKKWHEINSKATKALNESKKGEFNNALKLYKQFLVAWPALESEREDQIINQINNLIDQGRDRDEVTKIFYRIGIAHDDLFDRLKDQEFGSTAVSKVYDFYPPFYTLESQLLKRMMQGEELTDENAARAFLGLLPAQNEKNFEGTPEDLQKRRERTNERASVLSLNEIKQIVKRIPRIGYENAIKFLVED